MRRVAIPVADSEAEAARATLLQLLPEGFGEAVVDGSLELAAYVDEGRELLLRSRFPEARSSPVAPGWEDGWRSFHTAVRSGGVWIGPPWETPPRGEPSVMIEPGRAFGTGAHASSRLCVELLARLEPGSLLDVGCGSGVLALAAARLGFEPLTAVDVDPVAVSVTVANAKINGVMLDVRVVDALSGKLPRTDVVVANLDLERVVALLPRIPAGIAVTAGYLSRDAPAVPGWRARERAERDSWAADILVRD